MTRTHLLDASNLYSGFLGGKVVGFFWILWLCASCVDLNMVF
jgi:hypothetical protein